MTVSDANLPPYAAALQTRYQHRCERFLQYGLGLIFDYQALPPAADLGQVAWQFYCDRIVEGCRNPEDWRQQWQWVYQRAAATPRDCLRELLVGVYLADYDYFQDPLMDALLEEPDPAVEDLVKQELSAAFDALEVVDLRIYRIGDGEQIEGILIAAQRTNGEVIMLAYLDD